MISAAGSGAKGSVSTEDREEKLKGDLRVFCQLCKLNFLDLKLLKCLHYFCSICLKNSIQTNFPEPHGRTTLSLCCPLCSFQYMTVTPDTDIDNILKDIAESQILLTINDQGSILMGNSFCAPCYNRNKNNLSEFWCYDCRTKLCKDCLHFHDAMPTLVHHSTYSVSELLKQIHLVSSSREICEKHGSRMRMYCTCHRLACCDTCIVNGHKICPVAELEVITNNVKEQIDEMKKSLVLTCADLNDVLNKNLSALDELELREKENTNHISENFQKFSGSLITKVDNLTAATYKVFYYDMQHLETQTVSRRSKLSVLENCKDVLKACLSGSNIRIFLECKKVQKQYLEIQGMFRTQNMTATRPFVFRITFENLYQNLCQQNLFGEIKSKEMANRLAAMKSMSKSSPDLSRCKSPEKSRSMETKQSIKSKLPSISFNNVEFHHFASLEIKDYDFNSHITGCDWVSDDKIIVVDRKRHGKSNVRLYDLHGNVLKTIIFGSSPYDVVVLDNGNAAITVPKMREISIPNLNTYKFVHKFRTGMECYGICKVERETGTIVVAGDGRILIMNTDGEIQRTLSVDGQDIRHVYALSKNLIFYSSLQDTRVFSVMHNGKERYCFQPNDVNGAAGLIVDDKLNAYVCEKGSNFLFKLDRNGILQQDIEVGSCPSAIALYEKGNKICIVRGGRKEKRRESNFADIYLSL